MTVAKREGISKATEELALTQSAVSRQIQSLEESLGVELFVRRGRSLSMTEAGRILLEYGARTFQVLAEAREATGLPIVTEAMSPEQVPLVAKYADVIHSSEVLAHLATVPDNLFDLPEGRVVST